MCVLINERFFLLLYVAGVTLPVNEMWYVIVGWMICSWWCWRWVRENGWCRRVVKWCVWGWRGWAACEWVGWLWRVVWLFVVTMSRGIREFVWWEIVNGVERVRWKWGKVSRRWCRCMRRRVQAWRYYCYGLVVLFPFLAGRWVGEVFICLGRNVAGVDEGVVGCWIYYFCDWMDNCECVMCMWIM